MSEDMCENMTAGDKMFVETFMNTTIDTTIDTTINMSIEKTIEIMMNTTLNYIKYILLCFIFIFIWEHFGRKVNLKIKPSIILNKIANVCQLIFQTIGKICAYISSFYTFIDITELKQTFFDIFNPTIKIATSGYYFVKGYISIINLYKNPHYLVCFGTVTLVSIFVGLLYYYEVITILSTILSIIYTVYVIWRMGCYYKSTDPKNIKVNPKNIKVDSENTKKEYISDIFLPVILYPMIRIIIGLFIGLIIDIKTKH